MAITEEEEWGEATQAKRSLPNLNKQKNKNLPNGQRKYTLRYFRSMSNKVTDLVRNM